MKRLCLAIGLLLLGSVPSGAVGFQWAAAPDPDGTPLEVAIWYPNASPTSTVSVGPFDMVVARGGSVSGGTHPLIVMSHGTGGMALNSYDTGIALAEAGFVVASVTHPGDNYRDQANSFTRQNFVDRSRHVSRVIDFMVDGWAGHASVDPSRIGVFGHSAGGATALIDAGGIADMNKVVAYCRVTPEDWGCQRARQQGIVSPATESPPIAAVDTRIKAVVVAAPALAVAFQPDGLKAITVPVQLWAGAEDEIVRDAPMVAILLPMPPEYHLVSRAGHFAFLSPCSEILEQAAPEICKNPDGFDRIAFLREFQRTIIGFYHEQLK